MSNHKFEVPEVNFKTPTESTTLAEAFELCLAAEHVEKKVKGAFTGAFDTMRKTAVEVYRTFLSEAGDKPENIKISSMVGVFLYQCSEAESLHKNESSKTWNNYKSKFKQAMEKGINLQDNSAIGYSKLSATLKEINDAATAEAEAAAVAEAKKDGKVVDHPGKTSQEGSESVSGTDPDVHIDDVLSGLSANARDLLVKIISEAKALESMGKNVDKMLGSSLRQFSDCHATALTKLKQAS